MAESLLGESLSRTKLRRLLDWLPWREPDQSLRAQLEEAIDEHEEDTSPAASGDLSSIERQMLRNILHFSAITADDVAIPRSAIIAVPAATSWQELIAMFTEHGHSRMPVTGETLDEIKGMIHIKDVFPYLAGAKPPPKDWSGLIRQPLFVPQARGALDVLADMRASQVHLAVVIDEYSGTDGIITIEDLVEEIVGEIEDEHDDAPAPLLRALPEGVWPAGTWDADAKAELEDVGQSIDPRLAEGFAAADTLAGLALLLAGRVPVKGAMLVHPSGWKIEVTAANDRRVTRLRLHPPKPASKPAAKPAAKPKD